MAEAAKLPNYVNHERPMIQALLTDHGNAEAEPHPRKQV